MSPGNSLSRVKSIAHACLTVNAPATFVGRYSAVGRFGLIEVACLRRLPPGFRLSLSREREDHVCVPVLLNQSLLRRSFLSPRSGCSLCAQPSARSNSAKSSWKTKAGSAAPRSYRLLHHPSAYQRPEPASKAPPSPSTSAVPVSAIAPSSAWIRRAHILRPPRAGPRQALELPPPPYRHLPPTRQASSYSPTWDWRCCAPSRRLPGGSGCCCACWTKRVAAGSTCSRRRRNLANGARPCASAVAGNYATCWLKARMSSGNETQRQREARYASGSAPRRGWHWP